MVDIKERTNMSITLRPSDDYMELEYDDTHEIDKLLNECYPYDADIEEYPGEMVDNYIGYHPATQFIKLKMTPLFVNQENEIIVILLF